MKLNPQRSFKALGFVFLSSVLVAGFRTDASFQNRPAPKYVPPACQGKPLTVVDPALEHGGVDNVAVLLAMYEIPVWGRSDVPNATVRLR